MRPLACRRERVFSWAAAPCWRARARPNADRAASTRRLPARVAGGVPSRNLPIRLARKRDCIHARYHVVEEIGDLARGEALRLVFLRDPAIDEGVPEGDPFMHDNRTDGPADFTNRRFRAINDPRPDR